MPIKICALFLLEHTVQKEVKLEAVSVQQNWYRGEKHL